MSYDRRVVVIKLGGAAVTRKDVENEAHPDRIRTICDQIADYWKKKTASGDDDTHEKSPSSATKASNKELGLVIIHGAGSFGHHQAKRYELHKGGCTHASDGSSLSWQIALTHAAVVELSVLITKQLVQLGIPAVSCPPFGDWVTKYGAQEVQTWNPKHVSALLEKRFVPVLHGDTVFDANQPVNILSGDTIMHTLSTAFRIEHCIFVSDVEGIFTEPPENATARLIQAIEVDDKSREINHLYCENTEPVPCSFPKLQRMSLSSLGTTVAAHDVTHGIQGKIKAAQKALFGGHTNEADEKASVVSVIGYTGDSLRKTLLNITSGSPLAATLFNVRGTHFIKSSVLESLAEAG